MAATKKKHLKVLTGRPGHFELHEREAEVDVARESIQSHIILERFPAYVIAREKLAKGYSLVYDENLLRVQLNDPITSDDHRRMIVEAKLAVGKREEAAAEQAKPRVAFAPQSVLSILSETTKMGTFSFNLPAGPPALGGTCPASGPGFLFLNAAEQQQQQRSMVGPIQVKPRDWICGGCFALKNSYGNPSQIMFQAVRYMLTLEWLRQGTFVEHVINAIQASRIRSTNRLKKLPPERKWTVPHPSFFRIHDSGDFFSPEYARAWFEICKRLPDVMFWAPTRMWLVKKSASTVFSQGIPSNLALRPSALHFGEPAPRVDYPGTAQASVGAAVRLSVVMPGLAAGSGSGEKVPPNTWRCPAYEHVTKLGGAVSKLGATSEEETAGGTCSRAHGPNSPARGGKDKWDLPMDQGGFGCRACWRNRDIPIFYHEH